MRIRNGGGGTDRDAAPPHFFELLRGRVYHSGCFFPDPKDLSAGVRVASVGVTRPVQPSASGPRFPAEGSRLGQPPSRGTPAAMYLGDPHLPWERPIGARHPRPRSITGGPMNTAWKIPLATLIAIGLFLAAGRRTSSPIPAIAPPRRSTPKSPTSSPPAPSWSMRRRSRRTSKPRSARMEPRSAQIGDGSVEVGPDSLRRPPVRWWRRITGVRRSFEFAFGDTDRPAARASRSSRSTRR